jgi:hypothetical protein
MCHAGVTEARIAAEVENAVWAFALAVIWGLFPSGRNSTSARYSAHVFAHSVVPSSDGGALVPGARVVVDGLVLWASELVAARPTVRTRATFFFFFRVRAYA